MDSGKNGIFMRLIVLAIFLFFLVSCGGGSDSAPAADTTTDGNTTEENTDNDSSAVITSLDLIDQAVTDGELDSETALIYKTYAAFNDPRLPAEYAGDASGVVNPDFLWEATGNFDTLSPATQEILAPFLIPPMYSGSWWDLQQSSLNSAADDFCHPLREDCPMLEDWKYIAGTNVNVWYQVRYESQDQAKALQILHLIDQIAWPALTSYMNRAPQADRGGTPMGYYDGIDTKLDIGLVDKDTLGTTYPSFLLDNCGDSSTYILINRNADVLPIAVHEFMHSIQFALPTKDCLTLKYETMMESTANWAVDYIMPNDQWEHDYSDDYMDDITVPLLQESPDKRPYGAWLFPLYLTMAEAPDGVKQMWDLAATYSQPQVFENIADFDRVWPEFAARLWNQAPLDEFTQWDGINDPVKTGMESFNLDLAGTENKKLEISPTQLPGLSAHLFHITFLDPAIRTAGFFNGFTYKLAYEEIAELGRNVKATELTAEQRKGAHLHALAKINGTWETSLRDWTDVPYVLFSLDKTGDKVEELLLVFSNSDTDVTRKIQPTGLPSHFWLTNMPWASAWEGSVDLTRNVDGIIETFTAANIRFEPLNPPTAPVMETTDPAADLQMTSSYMLTAGETTYNVSGKDSNRCTYNGSVGTTQLPLGIQSVRFTLYSFIRSGAAMHGYILDGFDLPVACTVEVTCPTSGGEKTDQAYFPYFPYIHHTPDDSPALSSNGLSISGTGSDLAEPGMSGTWQLQVTP